MEYLSDTYADLDERIDNIRAIADVNEDLVKIAVSNLNSIRKDIVATGRNQGILQKVDRQLETYKEVAKIPELTTKFPIIREQIIVLLIGALEVFVSDIYKQIAENDPEFFFWNDEKEKISFEPSLLREGFSLGDALVGHLKNKGYSFQDLQSLIKSFEVYCGIKIELETEAKDVLIYGAASRHIIVHNRSIIDSAFLKQIRDTIFSNALVKKDEQLLVTDQFVSRLSETIKSFCGYLISNLQQRDD
ncbi:MAG: hypothetical protein ACO1N2_01380 [Candidatus Saccharimonadota bacterium]